MLWWLNGDPKFSARSAELIADPANAVLVSRVSLWEMLVKARVGKLTVDMGALVAELAAQDISILGLEQAHLQELERLPTSHKDPWDHLLMAQAIAEEAVFMSQDRHVADYPVDSMRCA